MEIAEINKKATYKEIKVDELANMEHFHVHTPEYDLAESLKKQQKITDAEIEKLKTDLETMQDKIKDSFEESDAKTD